MLLPTCGRTVLPRTQGFGWRKTGWQRLGRITKMKMYKGIDKDLKCRDFQYEIGKTYTEDKAELCNAGFHACEHPLDCMNYYEPGESRYCEVDLDDVTDEHRDDSKRVGKKITV